MMKTIGDFARLGSLACAVALSLATFGCASAEEEESEAPTGEEVSLDDGDGEGEGEQVATSQEQALSSLCRGGTRTSTSVSWCPSSAAALQRDANSLCRAVCGWHYSAATLRYSNKCPNGSPRKVTFTCF